MRSSDLGFRLGIGAFAAALLLIVIAVGLTLANDSWLSLQKFGWTFWRTSTWNPVSGEFGALPFIWGTLYSSVLALLIATPVSLGIAVFISELCPQSLRGPLIFLTELLAAIPSIVYGLWGIFVLVPAVRAVEIALPESLRSLALFSGPPLGVGMFAASLILAVMVVPFTSAVAREVLKTVPETQREAAYALGATRFEAIRAAMFFARTGIIGAVMLGFGRALGETMALAMLVGNSNQITLSVFSPANTLSSLLANNFPEAGVRQVGVLMYAALVLLGITLAVNIVGAIIIQRAALARVD